MIRGVGVSQAFAASARAAITRIGNGSPALRKIASASCGSSPRMKYGLGWEVRCRPGSGNSGASARARLLQIMLALQCGTSVKIYRCYKIQTRAGPNMIKAKARFPSQLSWFCVSGFLGAEFVSGLRDKYPSRRLH